MTNKISRRRHNPHIPCPVCGRLVYINSDRMRGPYTSCDRCGAVLVYRHDGRSGSLVEIDQQPKNHKREVSDNA